MNRFIAAGLLAAAATFGAVVPAGAQTGAPRADKFRLGVVLPFGGTYGIIGQSMRRAIEMALEERGNKVLGVPVEVMWEDDESKPQVGVQKANALISRGAHALVGSVSSPVTLAVMKLAEQSKTPLINTASADDRITGADRNRYTFRTSNNYTMEVRMVAAWLAGSGIKSIYGMGPDVGAARDGWALLLKETASLGVKVAGESFPPLGTSDYSIVIDKIAKSGAQAVVIYTAGGDTVTFVKQAAAVKLDRKVKIVGPTALDDVGANAIGPASVGLLSGVRYHFSVDSQRNRAFVDAYRKRFDEFPPTFAGTTYDGVSWWLDVVESTKSWDKEKWIAAFEGSVRDQSVQPRRTMRACDHQAAQDGLWAEATEAAPPYPKFVMKVVKTFPADTLFDACK